MQPVAITALHGIGEGGSARHQAPHEILDRWSFATSQTCERVHLRSSGERVWPSRGSHMHKHASATCDSHIEVICVNMWVIWVDIWLSHGSNMWPWQVTITRESTFNRVTYMWLSRTSHVQICDRHMEFIRDCHESYVACESYGRWRTDTCVKIWLSCESHSKPCENEQLRYATERKMAMNEKWRMLS